MHVPPSLRVVLAVTLATFVLCLIGLQAERRVAKRSDVEPAAETELSVDVSGSLTAAHAR